MSAAAADRLAEIQARADKATDGPWSRFETVMADTFVVGPRGFIREDIVSGPTYERENAEFIAHARADVPWLVEQVSKRDAALRAVLDLHRPVEVEPSDTICGGCSFQLPNGRYFGKVEEWPCDTVRAVEAALGVSS